MKCWELLLLPVLGCSVACADAVVAKYQNTGAPQRRLQRLQPPSLRGGGPILGRLYSCTSACFVLGFRSDEQKSGRSQGYVAGVRSGLRGS